MTTGRTSAFPATRYSTVAIMLHWLVAALLIFEIGLGLRMEAAHGATKFAVFQLHKSIGITILLLVAIRLLWRLYCTPPRITAKPWERALAHAVHALFYLLLFALPISGWIIVSTSRIVVPTLLYGTIPWPHFPGVTGAANGWWHDAAAFVHVNLVTVIYVLFALHVAGALKHHLVDRDGDIAKMAPGARPGAWADPRLIAIVGGVLLVAGLGRQWLPIGVPKSVEPPIAQAPALPESAAPAPPPVMPARIAPSAETVRPRTDGTVVAGAEATRDIPIWAISAKSTLHFHTTWSGASIDGGFRRFEGEIAFDPDRLDRSHVAIRVDTASVFSGEDQRDETMKSDDWFSTATFATATFKADRFRRTGTDHYLASGTLTIKGVTLPISLPFTLKVKGDKAAMQGTATVDRTAYKIGLGDYAGTDEIPAGVRVDVAIDAARK